MDTDSFNYTGLEELFALESAINYNDWLVELSKPYLGNRVFEIGAGIGTFTGRWLQNCTKVTAIEPSEECIRELKGRFSEHIDTRLEILQFLIEEYPVDATNKFDTVISFNVFEHIENDMKGFNIVNKALVPGGNFILFVPAFQCLYGKIDASVGHVRRYSKQELLQNLKEVGFQVPVIHYVNSLGFFAWLAKGRIMSAPIKGSDAVLYDKLIIPWLKSVERWLKPPLGQSLFVVARK